MAEIKPVRIGFIGCGSHARANLYPCLRFAECELVAVADLWEVHRAHCRRHLGAQRAYGGYRELLDAERDLDAVIVCGPPELHVEASLAALERGLPVLCEKPPGLGLGDAVRLRDASRAAGKPLMVAFMKRFAARYVQAKAIASSSEFGRITHLALKYSYDCKLDPRRTAALMGTHAFDLVRFFMGDPSRVTIERTDIDGASSMQLLYRFASGATATLVMNARWPGVSERLELCGTGAAVVVEEVATLTHYPRSCGWTSLRGELHHNNFALQTYDNSAHHLQGYAGEIKEFVDAVREGRPPSVTIDDGVEALRMVELVTAHDHGVHAWAAG